MSAADDTDTTRSPLNSGFTWVQLYVGDQKTGQATRIRCERDSNIDCLTYLVQAEYPELNGISSACLDVYPPGTPLDGLNDDAYLDPGDPVPGGTTGEQPLMVIAPPAVPSKCCECIHSRIILVCLVFNVCLEYIELHTQRVAALWVASLN
jgi:hypothetical protein